MKKNWRVRVESFEPYLYVVLPPEFPINGDLEIVLPERDVEICGMSVKAPFTTVMTLDDADLTAAELAEFMKRCKPTFMEM